jgi:hypothetical protein
LKAVNGQHVHRRSIRVAGHFIPESLIHELEIDEVIRQGRAGLRSHTIDVVAEQSSGPEPLGHDGRVADKQKIVSLLRIGDDDISCIHDVPVLVLTRIKLDAFVLITATFVVRLSEHSCVNPRSYH